jgi:hypothetical protein
MMVKMITGLVLVFLFLAGYIALAQDGKDHVISWTPSVNAGGYQLYCGNESSSYTQNLNIAGGNTSSVLLKDVGLANGIWFCAMTAYNFAGSSGFSNEINFAVSNGDLLHQAPATPTNLGFN